MQSSNFDATAFQSSIYGNSSSFDPGPFKVNHPGYSTDASSDVNNFYQSYISPSSAYPQAMPGYGCREPPSYVETSFFRHPSPSFMQNFNGGVNYYKMASNRQLDMNDYNAPGLISMTPALKQGDPFSYSTLQLESSFNSDPLTSTGSGSVNPSSGPVLPATEISTSISGQNNNNFLHHSHLHNTRQDSHQPSDLQEQKAPDTQPELNQVTYHGSPDSTGLFSNVKLEHSSHAHPSVSGYNKHSFDLDVPAQSDQTVLPAPDSNCHDCKPNVSLNSSVAAKPHSSLIHPIAEAQQNPLAKHENFNDPSQSSSPHHFKDNLGISRPSSSPSPQTSSSSIKDNIGNINDKTAPTDAPKIPGTEENGEAKPTMSYIALIAKAILESDQRRLNLGSIYHWIEKHYPFYKNKGQGWRNSVRHNLSLNDCFIKYKYQVIEVEEVVVVAVVAAVVIVEAASLVVVLVVVVEVVVVI
ncbi:forkhead box protein I1 [Elysia marginata]|uniref:Forkhead box protein I1 n=1 Tax=Elysia marginata TaxID=1093978 RepID=A0AAV4FER6_9GAST|nr:forkhead box protein I1 [Elysia marginata]